MKYVCPMQTHKQVRKHVSWQVLYLELNGRRSHAETSSQRRNPHMYIRAHTYLHMHTTWQAVYPASGHQSDATWALQWSLLTPGCFHVSYIAHVHLRSAHSRGALHALVSVCVYLCIYLCACIAGVFMASEYMYLCMYMCENTCVYPHMHVCMHVCTCILCACIYV